MRDERFGRLRIAADGGAARTENARLFKTDLLPGIAEVLHVIKIDTGDNGDIGVDDINCIQTPAQSHLEDHCIQTGIRQKLHDRQRGEFEISKRHLTARRLDLFETAAQCGIARDLAIDARSLIEMQQMR